MKWLGRITGVALLLIVGFYEVVHLVNNPAASSAARLNELAKAQDAYVQEHRAGCLISAGAPEAHAVGHEQEKKADGSAEDGGGHRMEPVIEGKVPCRGDASGIANAIALEAVRGATATVYFTFVAGVIAIGALGGALWSAAYSRRSWILGREARRGRVWISNMVMGLTELAFDVVNVGEVPILVGLVVDGQGNAHQRQTRGLAPLCPGEALRVSAYLRSSRIVADITFREIAGASRRTVVQLHASRSGWFIDGLREHK